MITVKKIISSIENRLIRMHSALYVYVSLIAFGTGCNLSGFMIVHCLIYTLH